MGQIGRKSSNAQKPASSFAQTYERQTNLLGINVTVLRIQV